MNIKFINSLVLLIILSCSSSSRDIDGLFTATFENVSKGKYKLACKDIILIHELTSPRNYDNDPFDPRLKANTDKMWKVWAKNERQYKAKHETSVTDDHEIEMLSNMALGLVIKIGGGKPYITLDEVKQEFCGEDK